MPLPGPLANMICALLCAVQTPLPQSIPQILQTPTSPTSTPQQPPVAPQAAMPPAPLSIFQIPLMAPSDVTTPKGEALPSTGVTAEPNPCLPGQTVTFYLPDGVKRGTVLGGRFKQRRALKPHELVTDEPKRTTTYTFDLLDSGESSEDRHNAPKRMRHQRYTLTIEVLIGKFPRLTTYHNPQHWSIDTVNGWIRNVIPQEDPATESLIYFQPEDDSPERVSVAVRSVKETTCANLMNTALMDAPTQYDVFEHIQQKETMQCGVQATWATFDGLDRSLPDTPTKSMILT